jgi:hypothetical protein
MSALLQERYALPVITCSLDLDERGIDKAVREPRVRFQLHLGAETLHDVSVPSPEMKLPPSLREIARKAGVRKLQMPQRVIDEFKRQLQGRPPDEPLWLRLASPSGHLGAVPWEHLLQPLLGNPILRLPEVVLPAVPTGSPLEIVVCACCPGGNAPYDLGHLLRELVGDIRDAGPGGTRITVFSDLEGASSEFADLGVHVHEVWAPHDDDDLPIHSPWLRCITEVLGEASVDGVHFICPGHLDASFGALWLDAPRTPGAGPPPVQAGEVCAFMTHIGAWAAGFTIPTVRAWPAGVRMLAHRVMKDITGPVIVDAPHHRRSGPGIGAAYRLLFGTPPVEVPRSGGMAVYVHPQRVQDACGVERTESVAIFEREWISYGQSLTLAGTGLDDALTSSGQPPRRLAAKQRMLEQWASELLTPQVESPYTEAANQGVADALAFMKELIAKEHPQDEVK